MSDPNVRELGRVKDIDDSPVTVGVDYDTVTVGNYLYAHRLGLEQAEQFAQLFVSAAWQAGQNARRLGDEVT
jgi:hypothetical protein